MKRVAMMVLAAMLFATIATADDPAPRFGSKVIEIHHRDPRVIADVVRLLGSGVGASGININEEMHTLTVRDFPENIAQIEAAIQRLDQPTAPEPEIELHVFVLIGNVPSTNEVPEELVPVMKQLQSTLRFKSYNLIASNVVRTRAGEGIEGNGVVSSRLLGRDADTLAPYTFSLRHISVTSGEKATIDIAKFRFSMNAPSPVGFETPVTLREGEKVVVGTSAISNKALIVVVTAGKI